MEHNLPLITTVAAGLGLALALGFVAARLRLPALAGASCPFVVAEQNRELVEKLRAEVVSAVSGDASLPEALVQAHVARARMLVIATPDTLGVRQMAAHARLLNPQIEIVVRSHNEEEEARRLQEELAGRVFVGEHELAQAMSRYVLERCRA